MNKQIPVKDDPLTLQLPAWMDTNKEYTVVWSEITESWLVVPF